MRKHYRYVCCGVCGPTEPVSHFRLIGGTNVGHESSVVRIEIPDDMKLEKWDLYSTTNDERLLKELNPRVMVRVNNKLTYFEGLQKDWLDNKVQPHEFHTYMSEHYGYKMWLKFGFITKMQFLFCHKFYDKILMLDKLPDITSQQEIEEYQLSAPMEENRTRIEMLKEYFREYPDFTDEVRAELLSYGDEKLLSEIYKYADHCCTNNPNEIEKHLKDDFGKQMMHWYWKDLAEQTIFLKSLKKECSDKEKDGEANG